MKTLPSFQDTIDRFPVLRELGSARRSRAIPFIQQLSATECGAACLAMVLKYHGKTVAIDALREASVSARDATNAEALIETGRQHGLRGRAVALDLDQLQYLERGAVLHWNFSHFVVFDKLLRDAVVVVDPARGRRRVSMAEFGRLFTGVALLFEPTQDFTPGRKSQRPLLRYLRDILTEGRFLPHILAASLLLQALGLAAPLLSRIAIDRVIPHEDYNLLVVLGWSAALLLVFQVWSSIVRGYLLLYLRTRLDSRMTLGFLDHLLDLPFDFFQRRSAGDLLTRLGSNSTVREILTSSVLSAILDGVLAVTYLIVLLALSLPIALLTLVLGSIQVALYVITRHTQRQYLAESLEAQAQSQGHLVETLAAIETLKSMGLEQRAAEKWATLFARQLNVSLAQGRLSSVLDAATTAVRTGSALALLGAGALQILAGRLTLGDMIALTAVANGFLAPLTSLVSSGSQLQQLVIYLERLHDVLQTPGERNQPHTRAAGPLTGAIAVEAVDFRYGPTSPLVVRGISIEMHAGEFVAIVGRSGSGKSTLARLLLGLYVPTEGRVLYDGVDLRRLDLPTLRRQIGVVTQQAHLFGGTIRSNIALGDPTMPLEAVVRAATMAQIRDDIEAMPMGFDTPLTDRGASLSGGQQQRVALARALARRPRVLLLDEATSQLDSATERAVQIQLAALECTRVVIAHRLSTIMHADRILVMDAGRIVEQGRHEELLARRGVYGGLVAAQMAVTPAAPQ